jgi:hypothetical protein
MARKFALVPESWLNARQVENEKSPNHISISEVTGPQSFAQMAELLPKNLRNRAKILLHYLEGKVTLNEHERVQYNDGAIGSHLLDIVRYYVSPLSKARPLDAPQFEQLITNIGVPSSALAPGKLNSQSNSTLRRWEPYK